MSSQIPSSSNFNFPNPPGIPSYPGTPGLNGMPGLQYGPAFDGHNNHGLTTNPYDNSLFEDVNSFQDAIFGQNGLGFPPLSGAPVPGVINGAPSFSTTPPAATTHAATATPPGTTSHAASAGGNGSPPSATQPNLNQHA